MSATALDRLPTTEELRAEVARNLEERRVLRTLLRIAQRRERQSLGRQRPPPK
jgi:hypothetical protein